MIHIYTDGSARNNGYKDSNGGFGVVVVEVPDFCTNDSECRVVNVIQEYTKPTTNNREEMKGILWAMENYGKDPLGTPIVYSDSRYAVKTFSHWMWSWRENGWKKANKNTPENLDLVQKYSTLYNQGYRINLEQIRGHNGDKWNELADALATGRITKQEVMKKYG